MRHLTTEELARLVDEAPAPEEREHLERCAECTAEMEALRAQTRNLSSLPDPRPPSDGWDGVEERLREEGLVEERPRHRGRPRHRVSGSPWLRAAAALVLFLGGTAVGAAANRVVEGGGEDRPAAVARADDGDDPPAEGENVTVGETTEETTGIEEAAARLVSAEERYVDALVEYRRLVDDVDGSEVEPADPAGRFAALETLVATSRAALREAPEDPFLNGVLAGAVAERRTTLQTIAADPGEEWY